MSLRIAVAPLLALALSLSGCASQIEPSASPTNSSQPTSTIDPTLIPSASPTALVPVDPALFMSVTGDYVFSVAEGGAWCTIVSDASQAICEISEAAAQYEPVETPQDCEYSFGYQIALQANKPETAASAAFICAGGYYSDPAGAAVLQSGESLTVGDFSCFVQDVTARCENLEGNYIVLGPKAWALGN